MKSTKAVRALLALAFAVLLPSSLRADGGDVTFGVNYPGAMIGYRRPHWAFELRAQGQDDTSLLGVRVNRLFPLAHSRHLIYIGIEGAQFQNKKRGSVDKAEGGLGGAYIGLETFFLQHVSLAVDAGPYYATASDGGESSGVLDFVGNASVNFHWRGRRP